MLAEVLVICTEPLIDPENGDGVDMPEDETPEEVVVEFDDDEVSAAEAAGAGATSDQETAVRI